MYRQEVGLVGFVVPVGTHSGTHCSISGTSCGSVGGSGGSAGGFGGVGGTIERVRRVGTLSLACPWRVSAGQNAFPRTSWNVEEVFTEWGKADGDTATREGTDALTSDVKRSREGPAMRVWGAP
jgi:hypothetical protein